MTTEPDQQQPVQKLRVHNLSVSLDGFSAGPDQSKQHPMGVGASGLHKWVFATRYGRQMLGEPGGEQSIDDDFLRRGDRGIGATIMGRNMFGPIRGPWPDESWLGWWGPEPPYRHPVFVLTHHARPSVAVGATTFHFVTDGIEAALAKAFEAADGQDVRLGGGAQAIGQYMRAGLVDELHVAIVPILLGAGTRLLDNLGDAVGRYERVEMVSSPAVTHVRLARR